MSSGVAAQFDMISATRFRASHRTYRLALIARLESVWEENLIATVETPSAIPSDEMADMEEVCRLISEGKPVTDLALLKRIHDRAEPVRRAMLEQNGVTNIAVDLIREARDEE
jgi:hypothetical protein